MCKRQTTPLAILAGGGDLPLLLQQHALAQGWQPHIIGLYDNIHAPNAQFLVSMGQVGRLVRYLRGQHIQHVVFCGSMRRPNLWRLRLDWAALKHLPRVIKALRGGDNGLMRALIALFEHEGFTVPQPEDLAPHLLMPAGVLGVHQPTAQHYNDAAQGMRVIAALGALDIGQACVVAQGRVLAVEAAEGTAAMLQRVAHLPKHQRGRGGVLVKTIKPQQERRGDLPTIGLATLAQAHAAGLAGVALGAGNVFVLHTDALRHAANDLGLFLVGV